jgi:hypothetical protein
MTTPESLTDAEIADFLESLRSSAARHAMSLQNIEDRLGLVAGFVQGLMEETDDWAFIIKTSVVVESALGQVLSASLIGDSLDRHIHSLPMDGRTGKIQLAQDLSLLGPKSAVRFRALCAVRNDFVHGLKVLRLSIPEYFSRMPEADFDLLVKRFFSSDREEPTQRPREKSTVKGEPSVQGQRDGRIGKYLVWTCACLALLELSEAQRNIDADKTWRNALMTLGHAFLARQQGDEGNARRHMREALDTLESIAGAREESGTGSKREACHDKTTTFRQQ